MISYTDVTIILYIQTKFKVSTYPKTDHFLSDITFLSVSDRSYSNLSFTRRFRKKALSPPQKKTDQNLSGKIIDDVV